MTTLPKGAYLDANLKRYITPYEKQWNPQEFERVSGTKLPTCSCSKKGDFILFAIAHRVDGGETEGQEQILVFCTSCAEQAGQQFFG